VPVKSENIAVYVSLSNTVALTVKKQWMYRHVHISQILKKVLRTSMGCLYHHSWLLPLNELSCPDKAISVLPYSPWSAHLISAITVHQLCFLYCRSDNVQKYGVLHYGTNVILLTIEHVLQIMFGWRETCVRWPWSCITHCHLNWKYWIWWVSLVLQM
jgi:hypothetical protein